jgi:hypothetical protein
MMIQTELPSEFKGINRFAVTVILYLTSIIMFTWLFFNEINTAANAHSLIHGFIHALAPLILLWSISALISAEMRYLNGRKLEVKTFIEVVMVLFLRKLIVLPVQDSTPTFEEVSKWVWGRS